MAERRAISVYGDGGILGRISFGVHARGPDCAPAIAACGPIVPPFAQASCAALYFPGDTLSNNIVCGFVRGRTRCDRQDTQPNWGQIGGALRSIRRRAPDVQIATFFRARSSLVCAVIATRSLGSSSSSTDDWAVSFGKARRMLRRRLPLPRPLVPASGHALVAASASSRSREARRARAGFWYLRSGWRCDTVLCASMIRRISSGTVTPRKIASASSHFRWGSVRDTLVFWFGTGATLGPYEAPVNGVLP